MASTKRSGKRSGTKQEIPAEKWKEIHAAYLGPRASWNQESLEEVARRFAAPLDVVRTRAARGEWEAERRAAQSQRFLQLEAPGAQTEAEFCARRVLAATERADGPAIGNELEFDAVVADSRVVWRRHMANVLLWEAMKASPLYVAQGVVGGASASPAARPKHLARAIGQLRHAAALAEVCGDPREAAGHITAILADLAPELRALRAEGRS